MFFFGLFLTIVVAPLLFVSGIFLLFYMRKNHIIFISYGSSFLVYNISLYIKKFKKVTSQTTYQLQIAHKLCIYLQFLNFLYLLCSFLYTYSFIYIDFLSILWYVPYLHYISLSDVHHHYQNAIHFIILSLLGTIFSFTQDTYWIRSKSLHSSVLNLFYKYTLHQFPLVLLWIQLGNKTAQANSFFLY
jgi:hypothetical protein